MLSSLGLPDIINQLPHVVIGSYRLILISTECACKFSANKVCKYYYVTIAYSSPNISGVIKLKRIRLVGHVASLSSYLFEISSSHGGQYEVQICLLGCTAV
jgi:hypothetical protein